MADNPPPNRGGRAQNGERNRRGGGRGGNRGGNRGRGRGFGSKDGGRGRERHSKADMGRGEWSRSNIGKQGRNNDEQPAKRRKVEDGTSTQPFTKEEIEGEARKPKRKVAVMIGYAGSGYKGMQINSQEKTIEGDLFKAFIAAGAISKANADDPKKSSLVRCARTDKGVHAAGNVISLKLIVEDADIIQKINDNLPPQIRVWGMERTNGSFSCYQTCDSRWYEYLIPTYSFIPPHPLSFLGKKLVESAEKEGLFETYQSRQEDAATFWQDAENTYVKPILDTLEPELRETVMAAIHSSEEENEAPKKATVKKDKQAVDPETHVLKICSAKAAETNTKSEQQADSATESKNPENVLLPALAQTDGTQDIIGEIESGKSIGSEEVPTQAARSDEPTIAAVATTNQDLNYSDQNEPSKSILTPLESAIKQVKAAYIVAKKAYRISDKRRDRVQEALNCYLGTCNFHNYTIQKTHSDPSAKRVIRSFKVGPQPIIINDTEWLSLKVHGQSFMMHQIRKMVAMAALVVRCGSPMTIIKESYGPPNISVPKAPGLGLLLERPVFDSYNERAVRDFEREKIDFDKYQKEMDEFKQREIYDRIFREEEKDHQFHTFFHHIDHYRTDYFLWVTATGISAAKQSKAPARTDDLSDDEADVNGEEG